MIKKNQGCNHKSVFFLSCRKWLRWSKNLSSLFFTRTMELELACTACGMGQLRLSFEFCFWKCSWARFSIQCSKTKTDQNESKFSDQSQPAQWTNQNTEQIHAVGSRRQAREFKMHASRSPWRLVLVLVLIGLESGTSFADQSQSKVMQHHSVENVSTKNERPRSDCLTHCKFSCSILFLWRIAKFWSSPSRVTTWKSVK